MEKKPTSGMAVAGLVLGIIALVSSFVPLLNLLSFPFVLLSIIFGAIGVWQTVKGSKGGKGLAIAGLVLGLLALVVTGVMYASAAAVADSAASSTASVAEGASETVAAEQDEGSAAYGVTIDGCRVTEDYAGEAVAVVTYTFTNNSEDATSFVVALHPEVFQNGVELNTAVGSNWDSETYLSDVKPGSSTTVEIGYQLGDMSDITVEVSELLDFDGTLLAEQTFSLA